MVMTDGPSTDILGVTLTAYDAGWSLIPCRCDGTKKPAFPWKQYQTERASRSEVRAWFAPGRYKAAAVVCGQISGGLQMVEMEGWAYEEGRWQTFRDAAVAALGEDRWREITAYIEISPSGGPHLFVYAPDVTIGNQTLAKVDGNVMMETRGEGGFTVIAGSVGHKSGEPWRVATEGMSLDDIATVTADELEAIFDAARSLDETPEPVPYEPPPITSHDETRPEGWMDATIDDFNASHDVLDYLPGWQPTRQETYNGEHVTRVHRDGSDNDHGAVLFDSGRIGFFSSNCPAGFEPYDGSKLVTYDPFSVMMLTQQGGNDTRLRVEVARRLREHGYGPPLEAPNSTQPTDNETSDASHSLAVRWVDEAQTNMPPEPEVLVTNLLRRGEVTVLGAPRAIGKTWASLNLATICARGEGLLFGSDLFRATGPATVLYFQGELGEWGSASRWSLVDSDMPEHRIAEVFERVRIRTTVRRVTATEDGTTYSDEHTDAVVDPRIEATIVETGADVVIIDPWATFFAGNENSNDEVEAAIVALIDIARRTSTAIWIVHHITAKATHGTLAEPEDLWRGASRLADAVSTRVTVLPHYDAKTAKEMGMDRIQARSYVDIYVLERNGPPVGVQRAHRSGFWWESWAGDATAEGGRPSKVNQKMICDALRRVGGKVGSKTELASILEVTRKPVERQLDTLISLGVVEAVPGDRGRTGYRLKDEGLP